MDRIITELYSGFVDKSLPEKQVSDYIVYTQDGFYFQLAIQKKIRIDRLKEHFSKTNINKLYLTLNIEDFNCTSTGLHVEHLDVNFFRDSDPESRKKKYTQLENTIVIVNNTFVGMSGMSFYADFYSHCDKTIFVGWDWDNHHWFNMSSFLAAHTDLYVPAHHENLFLLTRFNWLTIGPVYASTIQWSKQFLGDHLGEIVSSQRSDDPLGKHVYYAKFQFRNRIVTTLNQFFTSVGFTERNFHVRSADDRLEEWCSHKSHWIVPVLNDVTIRIFDALITGGIPIVPESLRFLPPVNAIPKDYFLFYGPQDIVNPKPLAEKARELFDKGGRDKLLERHHYALNNHHVEISITEILEYVNSAFNFDAKANYHSG